MSGLDFETPKATPATFKNPKKRPVAHFWAGRPGVPWEKEEGRRGAKSPLPPNAES